MPWSRLRVDEALAQLDAALPSLRAAHARDEHFWREVDQFVYGIAHYAGPGDGGQVRLQAELLLAQRGWPRPAVDASN